MNYLSYFFYFLFDVEGDFVNKVKKYFYSVLLLLLFVFSGLFLPIAQAQEVKSDVNSTSERELDLGFFKMYRFTDQEIERFTSGQMVVILNTYAAMYFSMNMYFTRNMFSIDVVKEYPVGLIDGVYQNIAALSEKEKRDRVRRLHLHLDGVSIENLQLSSEMEPALEAWEKQNGKYEETRKKFLITPKKIMQAYAEKMGLSQDKYSFLRDPSMDQLIKLKNKTVSFQEYFTVGLISVLMFMLGYFGLKLMLQKNKKLA